MSPVTSLRLECTSRRCQLFRHNGTIAHALLGYVDEVCHPRSRQVYRRRCFPWSDKAEPDKAADSGIAFYATVEVKQRRPRLTRLQHHAKVAFSSSSSSALFLRVHRKGLQARAWH